MDFLVARYHRGRVAAAVTLALLVAGCGVLPGQSSSGTTSAASPEPSIPVQPASSGPPSSVASDSAKSPGPSASAPPTLASRTFTAKGTYSTTRLPMRFDIVQLSRRGDLLDLRASLTNLEQDQSQDQRWQIGSRFNGAYRKDLDTTDGAFAGSVLTDRAGKKRYFAAADSAGACVCTVDLSGTFVDAGQTVELEATYAAPPTSTSTLDVTVPSLGTFRDLPLS